VGLDDEAARGETDLEVALKRGTSVDEVGLVEQGVPPCAEQEHDDGKPYDKNDAVARHRSGIGRCWCVSALPCACCCVVFDAVCVSCVCWLCCCLCVFVGVFVCVFVDLCVCVVVCVCVFVCVRGVVCLWVCWFEVCGFVGLWACGFVVLWCCGLVGL